MKVIIVMPTYNEHQNICSIIDSVFSFTEGSNVSILVVDDSSPDGTAFAVKNLIDGKYSDRLFILERKNKSGIASAYIDGFKWGMEMGYDLFVEMDADFSHNPKYLPEMLSVSENYDFVIGSRYVKTGGVEDWGLLRKFVSSGGSLYSRFILGTTIRDLTGGFNFWKRETLEKIGLDDIVSIGFLFQIELKYRAFRQGLTFTEYPIIFENRKYGKSKMSFDIFFEAVFNVWKLK